MIAALEWSTYRQELVSQRFFSFYSNVYLNMLKCIKNTLFWKQMCYGSVLCYLILICIGLPDRHTPAPTTSNTLLCHVSRLTVLFLFFTQDTQEQNCAEQVSSRSPPFKATPNCGIVQLQLWRTAASLAWSKFKFARHTSAHPMWEQLRGFQRMSSATSGNILSSTLCFCLSMGYSHYFTVKMFCSVLLWNWAGNYVWGTSKYMWAWAFLILSKFFNSLQKDGIYLQWTFLFFVFQK